MGQFSDKKDIIYLYRKVMGRTEKVKQETLDSLPKMASDAHIDTMFDTYYDPVKKAIVFGPGCAHFDSATGRLTIAASVENERIIIS